MLPQVPGLVPVHCLELVRTSWQSRGKCSPYPGSTHLVILALAYISFQSVLHLQFEMLMLTSC